MYMYVYIYTYIKKYIYNIYNFLKILFFDINLSL